MSPLQKKIPLSLIFALTGLACVACSPGGGDRVEVKSPYDASQIYGLSWSVHYAGYDDTKRVASAKQALPAMSTLYGGLVMKFHAQYAAEGCNGTLQAALDFARPAADAPAPSMDAGRSLAGELKTCRKAGAELGSTAATRAAGKDLAQMSDGGLILVAVTLIASGAGEPAVMLARETEALLQIDSR